MCIRDSASTILNNNVLVWARPSLLLVASSLKHTFISEDEMPTVLYDLVHLFPQLDGQVGVLLVKLILLLRHVLGLYLLESEAVELEDLAQMLWFDHTIWKLPMEKLASLSEAQVRLHLHVVRIKQIV